MRRQLVGVAAVALVAVAGCGGGTSYESTDELIAAVRDAGIPCGTAEPTTPGEVSCDYSTPDGDDTITAFIYGSDEEQKNAEDTQAAFAGFGGSYYVDGDGWAINLDHQENTDHLANELGGEVR